MKYSNKLCLKLKPIITNIQEKQLILLKKKLVKNKLNIYYLHKTIKI